MGVGYAEDLVVCSALGCDMFDCVFPTRTGRFGTALTFFGPLNLKNSAVKSDHRPIETDCQVWVHGFLTCGFLTQSNSVTFAAITLAHSCTWALVEMYPKLEY